MSTFIAFTIPKNAIVAIREGMRSYQDILTTSVPQEKWHCTMLFLGNTELSSDAQALVIQPIRQSFHPVVPVLSLGQGKVHEQLWAYIQVQPFLTNIRQELISRIHEAGQALPGPEISREFVPHIHIGKIQTNSQHIAVPDIPIKTTFSLSELVLFKSDSQSSSTHYEQLAIIPITP